MIKILLYPEIQTIKAKRAEDDLVDHKVTTFFVE